MHDLPAYAPTQAIVAIAAKIGRRVVSGTGKEKGGELHSQQVGLSPKSRHQVQTTKGGYFNGR
jgi:hypothetical protein